MKGLSRRIAKVEARIAPPRVVVVRTGVPPPPDLPDDAIVIRLWSLADEAESE